MAVNGGNGEVEGCTMKRCRRCGGGGGLNMRLKMKMPKGYDPDAKFLASS